MACSENFIRQIRETFQSLGDVRTRKMCGDWIVYVNDKLVITACDDIAYVKKLPAIQELMQNAECGSPYEGAKEHYILDIDNRVHAINVIRTLLATTETKKKPARS